MKASHSLLFGIALSGVVVAVGCAGEQRTFEGTLSGANEVPPVATTATGTLRTDLDGDRLRLSGSFEGLKADLFDVSGSPAHVHQGAPGENGPIVLNLAVNSADRRSGSLSFDGRLSDSQRRAFLDGRYYVNVHTAAHPTGELRVQLRQEQPAITGYDVALSGANEVPPTATTATGTTRVQLVGNTLMLSGRFQNLGSELYEVSGSPAHVHRAPAGQSGPIVLNLVVLPDTQRRGGTFELATTLTDEQRRQLEAGEWYVNVHTVGYPAGEIRAQLVSGAGPLF